MKEFEVWTEGYNDMGNIGRASFHGKFKGETFKDAVIAFRDTLTDQHSINCIDIERMCFWACRFYDNEADARKLYG
jgi:hypothetical protein